MKHSILSILLAASVLFLSSCGKSPSNYARGSDSTAAAQAVDYYACPMHPQVHSDKPGVCPICGMDLVKASNSLAPEGSGLDGAVFLNDRDQILANVATAQVRIEEVGHVVRAFGTLEIPDPNRTVISARFNGRIERLHVNAVGESVKIGDPLFDVYSPDLIQALSEYKQVAGLGSASIPSMVRAAQARLELLGLTPEQFRELDASSSVPLVTTYRSPATGTIVEKRVTSGSYVSEGSTLYEIADLSTLWNIAEVYETDAAHIGVGESAKLSITGSPTESYSATVSFVYPVVNSQTRTVKVRVALNNSVGRLKPGMYTETVFRQKTRRALTVPVGAVLMTGKRNLVYVKTSQENHFAAREVSLGVRFNNRYEITKGLAAGDVVVSEGGYLVDSESQLKAEGHGDMGGTMPSSVDSKVAVPPEEHKH